VIIISQAKNPDHEIDMLEPIIAAKILMDLIVLILAYITTKSDPTDRTVRI
jgi:hypothetical protein